MIPNPLSISCRNHTPDGIGWCGAACAMMILKTLASPGEDYLNQAALIEDIRHANKSGFQTGPINHPDDPWETDPFGLAKVLSDKSGRDFQAGFPTTFSGVIEDIICSLLSGSPIAIAWYEAGHWIVIPGIETSQPIEDPGDYYATKVWINNPTPVWMPPSSPPPPPHRDPDPCGSSLIHGANTYGIGYLAFLSDLKTFLYNDEPVYFTVGLKEKTLPKHPAGLRLTEKSVHLLDVPGILSNLPRALVSLERLLGKASVDFVRSIAGTLPSGVVRVWRVDRPNDYYYLAPLKGPNGFKALLKGDAFSGDIMDYQLFERPIRNPYVTDEQAWALIQQAAKAKGRILPLNRPSPRLIWRPCRESYTPYLPFYEFNAQTAEEREPDYIYVRLDGTVFESLNTRERGN